MHTVHTNACPWNYFREGCSHFCIYAAIEHSVPVVFFIRYGDEYSFVQLQIIKDISE